MEVRTDSLYSTYPSTRDSGLPWLGHIPAHWDTKPLFVVMKERQRKNIGNRETNVLSLSYGKIIRRDVESNFGLLPGSFETYQIVYPGNIVLRLTDLQNDKKSLRTGRVEEKGIITTAYTCLEVSEQMDEKFAHYLLHGYDLLKVFYQLGAGVRQTMKFEDLKRLLIVLPSRQEQETIAAFLDRQTTKIDALIAKKQRLLVLLAERRSALISKAATKGLNPNIELKEGNRWIDRYPNTWVGLPLKRWVSKKITDGPHETPEFLQEGIPFVSAEAVYNGRINFESKRAYISVEDHKRYSQKLKPQRNDIFMVKSGATTGKLAIVETDIEFNVWSPMTLIRVDGKKITPQFMFHVLNSDYIQNQVKQLWTQGTQPNISMGEVENIFVIAPSVEEQEKNVVYLDQETKQLDDLKAKVVTAIERLREYRSALISSAVTGKMDVRKSL